MAPGMCGWGPGSLSKRSCSDAGAPNLTRPRPSFILFAMRIRANARWLAVVLGLGASTGAQSNRWVTSWISAQQLVEPANMVPAELGRDVTLRQIVHVSLGGSSLRVTLSNRYGGGPLHFAAVHVARP